MALSPIAFISPNFRDFKNYFLKAYEPGSTTPKVMALDSAGVVTVAKLELNKDGFLESAGGALVIPYLNGAYDLWLFPTEAEADANNTSNAERLADDITGGITTEILSDTITSDIINDLSQAYEFPTVAAYKAFATAFPDGKVIEILEYTAGNGGGARYTKITGTGTANNMDIIASTSVSQSIVISVPAQLNVKSLGLNVSNTAAENVSIINRSMAISGNIIFPDRGEIYMVDSTIGNNVLIPSNSILTFAKGVTLQSTDNADNDYRVIWINNVVNVKIFGGIFRGDKNTHLGTTGEGGHAIGIYNSADISMFGSEGHDAWGVGLALVGVEDFYGEDIYCSNGRQNGCAIVFGRNIELVRPRFVGASGTAPAAGIDIEPNNPGEPLEGIRLIDPITENNEGVGINIALAFLKDGDTNVDITITGHVDRGSLSGFWVAQLDESSVGSVDGSINYVNGTSFDAKASGILISNYASTTTPKIKLVNPTIYRPNSNNSPLANNYAGISMDRAIAFTNTNKLGNVHISNPTIIDNRAVPFMVNGINFPDQKEIGFENVLIENPLEISGTVDDSVNRLIPFTTPGARVIDGNRVLTQNLVSSFDMGQAAITELVSDAGGQVSFKLPLEIALGDDMHNETSFTVTTGAGFKVIPPANTVILPLSTVAGKFIVVAEKGAYIKLRRLSSLVYIIENMVGNFTVEP